MITREKRGSRGEEENSLRGSVASYLLLVACMHQHPDSFSIDWGHTSSSPVSCTLLHSALPISPFLSYLQPRGEGSLYTSTQPSHLSKNIGGKNFHSSQCLSHLSLLALLVNIFSFRFLQWLHWISIASTSINISLTLKICSCCFAV